MDVLRTVLTVILLIVSILMIVVVLMQQTKSGGLGAAFGGDAQMGGNSARGQAASKEAKLQKLTKIFAIVIGVLALIMVAL